MNKTKISIYIPKSLHTAYKIKAAEQNTTISYLIEKAMLNVL